MANDDAFRQGRQILHSKKSRYHHLRLGTLFKATHQTPGTGVTGQTSFDATTPTFLIQTSGDSKSIVGLSFSLSQSGTVAGAAIDIAVAVDETARRSSGGTAITPLNSDMGSSTSSVADFYVNPTASAASANVRYLWTVTVAASIGTTTSLDFEDGIGIGTTGSILIYTFAATTGPTWRFGFEWTEE
jgi:hypothetical protein